jgi:hypothetical protein
MKAPHEDVFIHNAVRHFKGYRCASEAEQAHWDQIIYVALKRAAMAYRDTVALTDSDYQPNSTPQPEGGE